MPRLYPLDPDYAQRIVERRHALGLSQNDLALAAGLTEGAISKYESCRVGVPPQKRTMIESALTEAESLPQASRLP
jgi:transcriptional regulator with XRE-family HTH domain